ncbi:MAG: S8 family serine peptidase [Vulcanimicrobiota bacterium]
MNQEEINKEQFLYGTPFEEITPEWAWGGATGKGIKIAVIDSGVDVTHPVLGNCVKKSVKLLRKNEEIKVVKSDFTDSFGHGTACAGVIHEIAPDAEIYSVKVLGSNLRSTGDIFISGLKWALENNVNLVNLSLGTTKSKYYSALQQLTDSAYFKKLLIVAAQNNSPTPSFPAVFSSIIGVKAIYNQDPFDFYFSANPPVEFLIKGVDVKLPWLNHSYETCTGNSFAAPHLTGIIALILSKHPWMTPFMVKSVLYSIAVKKGLYSK